MKLIFFIVLLVAVVGVNGRPGPANNEFFNLLSRVMGGFASWLYTAGLDPSKATNFKVQLEEQSPELNVTGKISKQTVTGMSKMWYLLVLKAELDKKHFQLGFEFRNLDIQGEYHLQGNILPDTPISGSGKFGVTAKESVAFVNIAGFRITKEGYIDMKPAKCILTKAFDGQREFHLENLEAGESEPILKQFIEKRYMEQLAEWFPLCEDLKLYLDKVFGEAAGQFHTFTNT